MVKGIEPSVPLHTVGFTAVPGVNVGVVGLAIFFEVASVAEQPVLVSEKLL